MEIGRAAADDVRRVRGSGVSVLVLGPPVENAALRDFAGPGLTTVLNSKLQEAVADSLRYVSQEPGTAGDA